MDKTTIVDVLLVEDNPFDAEMIVRALKRQNIANPLTVLEDGADALDFLFCRGAFAEREPTNMPKVILLDIKMPKVDGIEALRAIKADARTSNIPVVMVTSSRDDPDIQTAYALGANSYVVKPVRSDDFMEAMSRLGLYWLLVNQTPK